MSVPEYARRPAVLRPTTPSALEARSDELSPVQRQVLALQRAAGNRAVTAAVQRLAWVAGVQADRTTPGLTRRQKSMGRDQLVRDYVDAAEFLSHSQGNTDYLGNLRTPASQGTWVRFSSTGTNLLGENHTHVTLQEVLPAVGSKSFIYEPFSTDVMPKGAMKKAYEKENKARFKKFGVSGVKDKRQFGEESLYPKIGASMNWFVDGLTGVAVIPNSLKAAGGYTGQPIQRYLKIAWGFAKDTAAEVARLTSAGTPVPADKAALAAAYTTAKNALGGFVPGLALEGFIGDSMFASPLRNQLIAPLRAFARAVVDAMIVRAATDPDLTPGEQGTVAGMPTGTVGQKDAMFGVWRNMHFAHSVDAAEARGVRYAGMGNLHLIHLRGRGLGGNSHPYDMTPGGAALVGFETLTNNRLAAARPW